MVAFRRLPMGNNIFIHPEKSAATTRNKTIGLKAVKNSVPVGTVLDNPLLLVMHVLRTMDIQFVTVAFAGKIHNNVYASANASFDTLCHNIFRFRRLCIGLALILGNHTNDIS